MPKTVIIIDDDQDDLDVIRETINAIDGSLLCISFVYPEEALRVITKELVFTPDYIVSDINMPRITGDVLLTRFRTIPGLEKTVIAMLSTSIPTSVSKKLKDAGADFTFQKPTRLEDYLSMFKQILSAQRTTMLPHADRVPHTTSLQKQIRFQDLKLGELTNKKAAIYIIDYSWNYLFANTSANDKIKGYNVVGKNITEVWKELPQYNFQPVYMLLKDNVNSRTPMEMKQRSPVSHTSIKIVGEPLADCYMFNISEVNEN